MCVCVRVLILCLSSPQDSLGSALDIKKLSNGFVVKKTESGTRWRRAQAATVRNVHASKKFLYFSLCLFFSFHTRRRTLA